MFAKSYELPLSRDYVRHWGMSEGVRELIQNALDSASPFEYEFGEDWLEIRSRHSTLKTSSLLLGATSKADSNDTIGSFGEGYKIALLVLTREGYDVQVLNGDRLWIPLFVYSRQFDHEVLCVRDSAAKEKNEGLTFRVGGLSPNDIEQIRSMCLKMQAEIGEVIEVDQGRILLDKKGKLYVGSLFVCDTQMEFGYDVKPKYLRLERDRQTVSAFDLQWLTKEMWFKAEQWDVIAAKMESDCPDLEYAHHGAPELVKEACYQLFRQKYPDGVAAKSQEELERLVEAGMERVVVVPQTAYYSAVTSSKSYANSASAVVHKSPTERLQMFLSANRGEMQRKAIVACKALIEESKHWRLK